MNVIKKAWCALWGHNWLMLASPPGVMGGIGAPRRCLCCDVEWEGIKYPPMPPRPRGVNVNPAPTYPRPVGPMMARGYQPREATGKPAAEVAGTIKQGLADLRTERAELEQRLHKLIANEVSAFSDRTGASVASIDVRILDVDVLGAPKQRRVMHVSVATLLD